MIWAHLTKTHQFTSQQIRILHKTNKKKFEWIVGLLGSMLIYCICTRAERLIAFAIISRYEKTRFLNGRGCDYTSRDTRELCMTIVWYLSTARESIRRRPLSYRQRSVRQRRFKSNTSKQSSEEASCWDAAVLPSLQFAAGCFHVRGSFRTFVALSCQNNGVRLEVFIF